MYLIVEGILSLSGRAGCQNYWDQRADDVGQQQLCRSHSIPSHGMRWDHENRERGKGEDREMKKSQREQIHPIAGGDDDCESVQLEEQGRCTLLLNRL